MFTNQLDRQDCLRSKPYFIGAPGMNRTCDLRFRKPLLYPLSYGGRDGTEHGGHSPPHRAPLSVRLVGWRTADVESGSCLGA